MSRATTTEREYAFVWKSGAVRRNLSLSQARNLKRIYGGRIRVRTVTPWEDCGDA